LDSTPYGAYWNAGMLVDALSSAFYLFIFSRVSFFSSDPFFLSPPSDVQAMW
jgi:hypothetical protein